MHSPLIYLFLGFGLLGWLAIGAGVIAVATVVILIVKSGKTLEDFDLADCTCSKPGIDTDGVSLTCAATNACTNLSGYSCNLFRISKTVPNQAKNFEWVRSGSEKPDPGYNYSCLCVKRK